MVTVLPKGLPMEMAVRKGRQLGSNGGLRVGPGASERVLPGMMRDHGSSGTWGALGCVSQA